MDTKFLIDWKKFSFYSSSNNNNHNNNNNNNKRYLRLLKKTSEKLVKNLRLYVTGEMIMCYFTIYTVCMAS